MALLTQPQRVERLTQVGAWRRWTLASFLARLPATMTLLALVLAGERVTGSVAIGAQLAGVATGVGGLAALWRGRRLDRAELRGGLQRACLLLAAVLAAEAAAVALRAPVGLLFALAAVHGLASAGILGGFRALLPAVTPPALRARANVLDAVGIEVAFVSGPALAGILALVTGPAGVLALMAAAAVAAVAVSASLPRHESVSSAGLASPLSVPAARVVYALTLAIGFTFGVFESAVPARLPELGMSVTSAGPMLALIAAGSAVGGLLAARSAESQVDPVPRTTLLLAALGLLIVPLALLGVPVALGVALFAAGMPIAPLNGIGALVLSKRVPAGRQAEGFAAFSASILIGAGLGQLTAGRLLDAVGPQRLLEGAGVVPLLLALVLATYRWVRR